MQNVKLLSQRREVKVEVEINGVMIELRSMTCQSQDIDLSILRLENVFIVDKRTI
jgi:hypothetical protein